MSTRDTVLVLDDEPDTLALSRRVLAKKYELILATSGEEALAAVENREIAAVVVDQRMPTMTGLEFLVEFAKTHPSTARIVMTAYTDLEVMVDLINRGRIDAFIVKPWTVHEFALAVDREVSSYIKSRELEELNRRLVNEHHEMFEVLRDIDPDFEVPKSNRELKDVKERLRRRVADEVELLFLQQLGLQENGNIAAMARTTDMNRTFLHRMLRRHGVQVGGNESANDTSVPKEIAASPPRLAVVSESGDAAKDRQIVALAGEMELSSADSLANAWSVPRIALIRTAPSAQLLDRRVKILRLWNRGRRDRSVNPLAGNVDHLIGSDPADPESMRDLLSTTLRKIETCDFPDVSELLGVVAPQVELNINRSNERELCLQRLGEFASEAGLKSRAIAELCNALDELFTNAVYNAPFIDGEYLYQSTSRAKSVTSPKRVRIQYAYGADSVGIAVRDEYGSLAPSTVLGALRRCFEAPYVHTQDKAGGAGIGFFMVLMSASRMVVNIDPGNHTEIIIIRNRKEKYRQFVTSAPTLNVFEAETDVLTSRRYRRIAVDWPTFLSCSSKTRLATIRDVSEKGAFVHCKGVLLPAVGVDVELTIAAEGRSSPTRVPGIVRWRGLSSRYGCAGIGIEFAKALPGLVAAASA